jgi:hypothetical protein
MSVKVCGKCGNARDLACYNKDARYRDGFYPRCKQCRRVETRRRLGIADQGQTRICRWCDKTFDLAEGRQYYCSPPCAAIGKRLWNIERLYGLTREQYKALYARQGRKCAICKRPERSARNKLLAVDHCHETGQVRGLLCTHCNRAIGLLQDDPKVVKSAAEYITRNLQLKLVI